MHTQKSYTLKKSSLFMLNKYSAVFWARGTNIKDKYRRYISYINTSIAKNTKLVNMNTPLIICTIKV